MNVSQTLSAEATYHQTEEIGSAVLGSNLCLNLKQCWEYLFLVLHNGDVLHVCRGARTGSHTNLGGVACRLRASYEQS